MADGRVAREPPRRTLGSRTRRRLRSTPCRGKARSPGRGRGRWRSTPRRPDHAQHPVRARLRRIRPGPGGGELIEVGFLRRRGPVAPRKKPPGPARRVPGGRLLPLRLRREVLASPPGVRVRLVPGDEHDRKGGVERPVEDEARRPPAVWLGLVPVLGRGDALLLYALPAGRVPELALPAASAFDKLQVGALVTGVLSIRKPGT